MIDIAVHDLNKYYGSNHVLKNISLVIYNGEKIEGDCIPAVPERYGKLMEEYGRFGGYEYDNA
jgi:hypothetical protein